MVAGDRLVALDAGEGTVLLLFQRGKVRPVETPGGLVPAHDAGGPGHLAFAIDAADIAGWEARLAELGDRRREPRHAGNAAASASTSAIPTTDPWSSRRRASGRRINVRHR